MVNISLSTIFTSIIINSFLLIIVVISLKKLNKNRVFSTGSLFFLISLSILTLALPLEFKYTLTIPSRKVMPFIQDVLRYQLVTIKHTGIEIYMILIAVWILGSLVKFISLLRHYLKMKSFINLFKKYKEKVVIDGKKVDILKLPVVDSPSVVGIIKPTILLPNLDISNEEYDFIIKHEGLHISNSDLIIKCFYELLLTIYWWNPLGYVFKDKMNQTLEIRVDEGVLQASKHKDDRVEYVESLVNISKQIQNTDRKQQTLSASFAAYNKNLLLDRSKNILNYKENKFSQTFGKYIFFPLLVLGFFLTSAIVFEPYTAAPVGEEVTTVNEIFFVKNGTTYDWYQGNTKITSYSEEEFHSVIERNEELQNIKVYDEKGEEIEK